MCFLNWNNIPCELYTGWRATFSLRQVYEYTIDSFCSFTSFEKKIQKEILAQRMPNMGIFFFFLSVLSYIFISYEYSKNRTRMLGNSVHEILILKSIRFPGFIFKSLQESLLGAFFPAFTSDAANTLTGVNELLPLWAKAGSETSNIVPQVLWQSALNAAFAAWLLSPPRSLKTRLSRVSAGYPPLFTTTLLSFLLHSSMLCDRTITITPELACFAPPWLQRA